MPALVAVRVVAATPHYKLKRCMPADCGSGWANAVAEHVGRCLASGRSRADPRDTRPVTTLTIGRV